MKFSVARKIAGITGLFFLGQNISWSAGEVLPGAAQPETVSKALRAEEPVPQQAAPSVTQPAQQPATPGGEAAKKIKFQLNGIILEGNHVYTNATLEKLYKKKLHKTISVAELFEIVQSITNYYRNNGYVISRAILPPQHVKGGVVKIQIIEGFIDKVDVAGHPHGAKCLVLAMGEQIKKCPPLEISRMERYLLVANEIPATSVKAVLSPSKKTTGAADLTLVTETRNVTGYASYDNYGTRYIGPQQLTGNIALNSLITSGDATQYTFTKTPRGSELTYQDINYNMAVDDYGTRMLFGGTKAHTRPQFILHPVKIDGLNDNYYTTLSYPVIRTRTKSFTWLLAANYLDSVVTTFNQKLYQDHLRNIGAGFTYNFTDSYRGANLLNAEIRKGLPILGYTQNTNINTALTSRPGGHADYTKIDGQYTRLQGIKGALTAYLVLKGQWAFNALLASEQFTFGGSLIGRGYDVAELIGDSGAAGSLELRYDMNIGKILQTLQFYVYYDAGMIWNFYKIGGVPKKVSGTAAGFGGRFFFTKYVSGNLMWTQVLTKQIAAEKFIGDGKRPRVFFSIVVSV